MTHRVALEPDSLLVSGTTGAVMKSFARSKTSPVNDEQIEDVEIALDRLSPIQASRVFTLRDGLKQPTAVLPKQNRPTGGDGVSEPTGRGIFLLSNLVKRRARRRRLRNLRRSRIGNERTITLSLRGRAVIKRVWKTVGVTILACVLLSGGVGAVLASVPRSYLELRLSAASGVLEGFVHQWLVMMLVLIAYWPLVELLRLLFTEIEISSHELVTRHGVLVREELRIALPTIVDVSLHQDALDAVLGVYTLALELRLREGDSKLALPGVQLLEGLRMKKIILEQLPRGVSYSF